MSRAIYLLRHAKSSWSDPNARDFDRPLNQRGIKACEIIGQHLRRSEIDPDLVICSPARRTRTTAELIAEARGIPFKQLEFDEALYGASAVTILEKLRGLSKAITSVLIVGHNPAIQELALLLASKGKTAFFEQIERKYPTGALCQINFPADDWDMVGRDSGMLNDFVVPKRLRQ